MLLLYRTGILKLRGYYKVKYRSYETDFVRCSNCGNYVDQESLICRKCGTDMEQEMRNGKSANPKNRDKTKKYH